MIEFNEAIITNLIFHKISNENHSIISDSLYEIESDESAQVLKKTFLKPFLSASVTYEFNHKIDIELNPLYMISKSIYEDADFVEKSKDIFQHLKSVSKHPNIKDGDLFVVSFEDIKLSNTYYDALGIYKIENKETFIETIENGNTTNLKLKKGISGRKLDKAVLILFTKKPYTVLVIDNAQKETDYWVNEFINVKTKNDSINNTNEIINLTKKFIKEGLPEGLDISKADQVDFLNKAVEYFKKNEDFDMSDFKKVVMRKPEVAESFDQYKSEYEFARELAVLDRFSISEAAVKKQARALKSVIKLDKNFHIYVHGDRDMIEQGTDEEGRKYYKIYYREES